MMTLLAILCFGIGFFFVLAGVVGLLRFPDLYTRLHAVTKADNLGLGFILAGAALMSESWLLALKLLLIWGLILFAGAISGYLIAREGHRQSIQPSLEEES